jgi:hypothetical protein
MRRMSDTGTDRQAAVTTQKAGLIAYLRLKVDSGDWHGVMDAAADIRELEARVDELARATAGDQTIVCAEGIGPGAEPCTLPAGHAGAHQSAAGWTTGNRR